MSRLLGIGVFSLGCMLAAGAEPPALTEFSWLAGRWNCVMPNGDRLEEVWTVSEQDLLAAFRWADKEGKPKFYELIVVAREQDKLVMRLRHFNRDLSGWEDKTKPLVFEAVSASGDKVQFAAPDQAGVKLTYERTGVDGFSATLDRPDQPPLVMKFTRANPR